MTLIPDPPPVHLDINQVSKSIAILGAFIVGYGQVSYTLKERLHLSEPLIAVTLGIIVGPHVLDWVDPRSWGTDETYHELTFQLTRIVVGVQVLFTGIDLPKAYLRKELPSLAALLLGIMTIVWFVTGLFVWALIGTATEWHLTFLDSLALAAAITPTDPVLASSIVKGRYSEQHVPSNIRNIILAESGANDGLGFPFLYLAIYLMRRANSSLASEVGKWVYGVLIYQIVISVCYGFALGFVARKTLRWAEARQYIDKDSFFAFSFGLAFFTLGTTGLFGSDDILACFVAGNSFTWDDWFRIRSEESDVQDILDMLLNAAVFIYIGAIIPWDFYHYSGPSLGIDTWRVVIFVLLILLLRRPPCVVAARRAIPALNSFEESAFVGFFGPIGVSAVFYIEVALRELPDERERLRALYNPVVLFTVFGSVLIHGITIPIFAHGPSVVRKTATLRQTRSITFITIPTPGASPAVTRASAVQQGASEENGRATQTTDTHEKLTPAQAVERELWNPLWSLATGILSLLLFWRKDSFWRREPAMPNQDTEAHKMTKVGISTPLASMRGSSIHEGELEGNEAAGKPAEASQKADPRKPATGETTPGGDDRQESSDSFASKLPAQDDAVPNTAMQDKLRSEELGPRSIQPPPPAMLLPTAFSDRTRSHDDTPSRSHFSTPVGSVRFKK